MVKTDLWVKLIVVQVTNIMKMLTKFGSKSESVSVKSFDSSIFVGLPPSSSLKMLKKCDHLKGLV